MSTNPHGLSSTPSRTNGAEGVAEGFRSERRNRVRTRVHWRVTFFREGAAEAIESVTQNLSSSGFYCLLKAPFAWGDALVCALEGPTYDPSGSGQTVRLE